MKTSLFRGELKRYFLVLFILFAPGLALAGSATYTSSGSFSVPAYTSLTVQLWGSGGGGGGSISGALPGGGGGGGGYTSITYAPGLSGSIPFTIGAPGTAGTVNAGHTSATEGGNGNTSTFKTLTASGGTGGGPSDGGGGVNATWGGTGGTGSGGSTNITGGTGTIGIINGSGGTGGTSAGSAPPAAGTGGKGGLSTAGNAGASGQITFTWTSPPAPTCTLSPSSQSIGSGASAALTYTIANSATSATINGVAVSTAASGSYSPAPTVTTSYTMTVSNASGSNSCGPVTVTIVPAPTCTINISPDPSPYNYTGFPVAITWSSTNATGVYIQNFTSDEPASSPNPVDVASQTNTTFSCYGYNTTANTTGSWQNYLLTVNPAPDPMISIAASSTFYTIGQSQLDYITADFAAGSGDQLTGDNINGSGNPSPWNGGQGATLDPDTSKTITFDPTQPGTYTFNAVAETAEYGWSSPDATMQITVNPGPSCTVTLNPATIPLGQSSTLTYSSSNATSFSIDNVAGPLTPDTSNQLQESPTVSTDYTGTASANGVSTQCTAPGTTPPGTLTIACTESWSCNGQTIVQTNPDCSTSNIKTCQAPEFCDASPPGSSQCLSPVISFNASGNKTGHLQIFPSLVLPETTAQLYWNVSNAQGCTVQGSNGDGSSDPSSPWNQLASPSNGLTTSPITGNTSYQLYCTAYGSGTPVDETQWVVLSPKFNEL